MQCVPESPQLRCLADWCQVRGLGSRGSPNSLHNNFYITYVILYLGVRRTQSTDSGLLRLVRSAQAADRKLGGSPKSTLHVGDSLWEMAGDSPTFDDDRCAFFLRGTCHCFSRGGSCAKGSCGGGYF